jgi:hypothetical protein
MQYHIWDNDLTVDRVCAEAEARSPSVKPNQGNIQVATQTNAPGAVNTRFLEEIFGFSWEDASVGSFRVYEQANWTTYKALDAVGLYPPENNNYYAVSLFDPPDLRRKKNFKTLCALVVDDVGQKVDPAKVLAMLGEPMYRLETSPGSEHWGYRLVPWVDDLDRASRLIKAFIEVVCGGKDPGMQGVTRFVRLMEGTNTKPNDDGTPKAYKSRLLEMDTNKGVLNPEDVARKLGVTWTRAAGTVPTVLSDFDSLGTEVSSLRPVKTEDPTARALWKLKLIRSGGREAAGGYGWDILCPWSDDHTPSAARDTGTFYFRGGGFKCWHGHCEKKGPADVRARLDELLREQSGGKITLDDFEPPTGKLTVVDPASVPLVTLAPEPAALRAFFGRIVYHAGEDRFINLTNGTAMVDRALDTVWGTALEDYLPRNQRGNPITPSVWYRGHTQRQVVDKRTWWPGKPQLFVHDGVRYLNTWREIPRPLAGVPDAELDAYVKASDWLTLVSILFGASAANREHYLDYLAMVCAAVDLKPGHNPLFTGQQGIGKEITLEPVIRVLGSDRYRQLDQEALNGQFTDWVKHRLVVLPEVRRTTRGSATDHDQYQRLKALCDPGKRVISLNEKYRNPISVVNAFVLMMTSNEDRPMSLPADDRRLWVVNMSPTGWPVSRYQQLALWYDLPSPWGETNSHAIFEWLVRRWAGVDPFKMTGGAPMTSDKQDLIAISRSDLETWIEENLFPATSPLVLSDVFSSLDVLNKVETAVRVGGYGLIRSVPIPGLIGMGRLLAKLGCPKLNKGQGVPSVSGVERKLWAKPGNVSFSAMNEAELVAWLQSSNK